MNEDFDTVRERVEWLLDDYTDACRRAEIWYRAWRKRQGLPPIPESKQPET